VASLVDLFRQIVEHGFNRGDLSIADEICSDALIEHEYLAPRARGADILKRQVTAARDGLAGMHRLTFPLFNIGDQIATTPIPENYFNSTGERVVISDKRIWAFKHNPYVVVLDELEAEQYPVLDLMPDCRLQEQARNYAELTNSITASSQAEYMCLNLGFKDAHFDIRGSIATRIQGSCRTKLSCTRLDQTALPGPRHRSARPAGRMRFALCRTMSSRRYSKITQTGR
jgi:hypothetical protein